MAKEVKARFKISEGIITIQGKKLWEKEMLERFGKDCDIVATFRMPRRMRSNQQNSYYFGCVVPEVLDALIMAGFEPENLNRDIVHDMLRHKFLKVDLPSLEFNGEFLTITKSTVELTTSEFMEYIAEIQRWSAEYLNHVIPDPASQKEINYL